MNFAAICNYIISGLYMWFVTMMPFFETFLKGLINYIFFMKQTDTPL